MSAAVGILPEVPAKVTSRDVVESIRRSFGSDRGYVTIPEVQVGQSGRRCDVVALQMYRSRGIHLHGFEVKVDRRDWLRELKDAAKADELARYCLYWTVVAPPGIIDVTEVPGPWGYSECRGSDGKLFVVRKPPENPEVVTVGLATAARLISRAIEGARMPGEDMLRAAREGEYQRGFDDGKRQTGSVAARDRERLELLSSIERANGGWLREDEVEPMVAAYRAVRESMESGRAMRRRLEYLRDDIQRAIERLPS